MKTIEHWLHGKCEFKELVDKETNCSTCIHVKICKVTWVRIGCVPMEDICVNHHWSCSDKSCNSCIHKYTRYDNRQPILCFKCKFYEKDNTKNVKIKKGLLCTKCRSVICSWDRHDFRCCDCCNESNPNEGIFVDGGDDYFRFGGKGIETGEYKEVEVKILEKSNETNKTK